MQRQINSNKLQPLAKPEKAYLIQTNQIPGIKTPSDLSQKNIKDIQMKVQLIFTKVFNLIHAKIQKNVARDLVCTVAVKTIFPIFHLTFYGRLHYPDKLKN